MRTVALVLFVGVAGVVASGAGPRGTAAPVPKHLAKEDGDQTKLQGKWKLESLKMDGKDILGPIGQNLAMEIEFRGDAVVATSNLGGTFQKTTATAKHDAGAGVRRFTLTQGSTVDKDGKPVIGADKDETLTYVFDGDKLVMAFGFGVGAEAKPPADPLKPGPRDTVLVLVRVK